MYDNKDLKLENQTLLCNIMFNIKRRKHLYTIALRHSHIQLYKIGKGDSLGKKLLKFFGLTSVMPA